MTLVNMHSSSSPYAKRFGLYHQEKKKDKNVIYSFPPFLNCNYKFYSMFIQIASYNSIRLSVSPKTKSLGKVINVRLPKPSY